jgi:hypothetical protein
MQSCGKTLRAGSRIGESHLAIGAIHSHRGKRTWASCNSGSRAAIKLLEMHKPAQALVQFQATLKEEPRRFRSLYGAARAAQLSGHGDLTQKYLGALLTVCAHSGTPGRPEIKEAREDLAKYKSRLLRSGH